jgi:transcription elongation factor GreB
MSKAFTRETDTDDEELAPVAQLPAGAKNYITPGGYRKLQEELDHLWKTERP